MVAIADFVDTVMADVAGCNPTSIKRAILLSAIDFCRDTECWQYDHDDIPLISNVNEVELSLPDDSLLFRVMSMQNTNGDQLIQKEISWLNANVPTWRTTTGDGSSIKYYVPDPSSSGLLTVVAVPLTTVVPGLTNVRLVLIPTQTATTVGDIIYNRYLEDICYGAKWRLFRQKGQPWSDKDMASENMMLFEASKKSARKETHRGFSGKATSFLPHDYTSGNSRSNSWLYDTDGDGV